MQKSFLYFGGLCQKRGGTLAIFGFVCVCDREGWNSGYIHGSFFVIEKGGTLAIFMALCDREGWNSG